MEVEAMKHEGKAEVGVGTVEEWGKDFDSLWELVGRCFFRHEMRPSSRPENRHLKEKQSNLVGAAAVKFWRA